MSQERGAFEHGLHAALQERSPGMEWQTMRPTFPNQRRREVPSLRAAVRSCPTPHGFVRLHVCLEDLLANVAP